MSEDISLTEAVKLTAGISLTRAVKDVAGCRDWFFDEVLDAQDGATQGAATWRCLFLRCARLAAFAVLTFAFLNATSTSTILDAQRGSLAAAPNGVALVIGNSAYQHTPRLDNPKNDAADMAAALRKLGFQVIEGFDLDKAAFDAMVRDFGTALKAAEVGLFFYAGHGMQVSGHNYLVPVDAKLTSSLGAGHRDGAARARASRRWNGRQRPIFSSSMPAETILSLILLPESWARDHFKLGGTRSRRKRRGHANQLLDPAGKRGAGWDWPQFTVFAVRS